MLTPLPPLPSGISDYSALLLPELARHYDVEVVTDDAVDDAAVRGSATIRSTDWFRANHRQYDRIVYHLGNSEFHSHMFDLLAEIPGVVVLHDFALSGIVSHMDGLGQSSEPWRNDLYRSHGWSGLLADRAAADRSAVVWAHPVSLSPLQNALGVIVHSQAARRLADQWYGTGAADGWQVIPMPRATAGRPTRTDARRALGLGDELVVCSFGMVGPTKLSDRLVEAWCASAAAHTDGARLVFVGEHGDPAFTQHLRDTIERSAGAEVEVTGRVDEDTYARYLAAADIGVQLRARSRGETSASAYDCLASGLATIANANGSLAELPTAAVVLLDDDFRIDDLRDAIDRLASDPSERARLGTAGRAHVERHHRPTPVADRMVEAIEAISAEPTNRRRAVPALLREVPHTPPTRLAVRSVAQSIARSLTASPAPAQLLVDVSELNVTDAGSGIQRVTRNLVRQLLSDPPDGFRVEPVAATTGTDYRYARRFTSRLLGVDLDLDDDAIDVSARDVFLGLDLQPQVVPAHRATLRRLRQRGVRVAFVVYDLLPINSPEFFLPGAREIYERWMRTVRESDALLSISSSVRADVAAWLAANPVLGGDPALGWFHLGGDLDGLHPWAEFSGTPGRRPATSSPEFLMVGTIEPRKGHQQVLDAMELLWAQGHTARLTIIGRHGWMMEQFVEHLRHHPEAGRRLHVVEAATDAELAEAYRRSDCLIVASRGEGFGLPLIEAARHDLPVLARDLAVFREVAGDAVQYFSGDTPAELAAALVRQIELAAAGDLQGTAGMRTLSWHESSRELLAALEATVGLSHPAC